MISKEESYQMLQKQKIILTSNSLFNLSLYILLLQECLIYNTLGYNKLNVKLISLEDAFLT